jgi:hypothetical protein
MNTIAKAVHLEVAKATVASPHVYKEKGTMELPLHITSHDFAISPGIEAEIRKHADRLDTNYNRILRCRVVVEAPVGHHH